ncbi:unnamed protein product [Triticum aestivum]|uniref:CASP-like protein n=2 Tax=Triticum aestivum TaxID=4565 RepID=A0A9R1EQ72_WHEAT|nr:uncharacterized protein LOC123051664 [Triticum aestivum]KAF7014219.1 hypothetical protein CFC21_028235 [Triticum aestivum]KAF7014221.1 hypothetical protein CFC21_028237 [Triticum aestivum]SPT16466.1 unnamed protein product [Triticum aestivum]
MALTVVVVLPSPPPPPPEHIVVVVLPSPPPPPPPPPPVRIVVVAPTLVRFARVLCVAAGVLIFLNLAAVWIMSVATAAEVVARRAWGEGSAPALFLQAVMYGALKVCVCIILAVLVIVVLRLCVAYVIAAVSGSTSGFRKSTFGGIRPELTAHLFRLLRPVVLGFVVDMAFLLLIVIGLLVEMMSPHVEGSISQGEMVGSVIMDVGTFGFHATACFLIIPALVLSFWRER